jgi:hypothetical protein
MSSNRRSVLSIAAAAANALIGALLLAIGVAAIAALVVASIQAGGESWESLGTRASAELGEDVAGILELFGVSLSTLFAEFAAAQGLPEFPVFAREILAALYVGIALFVPTGLAALVAARAVWSLTASSARGALRLYAITLTAVGAIGIFIASAPHLIWGLVIAAGVLNLVALRRPRAVTPPYSA